MCVVQLRCAQWWAMQKHILAYLHVQAGILTSQ